MVRLYAKRKRIVIIVIVCIFSGGLLLFFVQNKKAIGKEPSNALNINIKEEHEPNNLLPRILNVKNSASNASEELLFLEKLSDKFIQPKVILNTQKTSSKVHAFYYTWFGNPEVDGNYYHWNHAFLPHWESQISQKYATGRRHVPPDDIGSNFYPALGPYSSRDPVVLKKHMEYIVGAGIGVLALSWYPPNKADDEGLPSDDFVSTLLDSAGSNGVKICFHIEPYKDRSAISVAKDIKYILKSYQDHPAFYKAANSKKDSNKLLPLVYVYDSYQISKSDWKSILCKGAAESIRGTQSDAIVIGLLVEKVHKKNLLDGCFDGFYTYFASSGFTYGSNQNHWQSLSKFANENNLIFIPSVGPGYVDTNVRPWNGRNTKDREDGRYYNFSWSSAISTNPEFISITSFNEWHEGTQIEPAVYNKNVHVNHLLGTLNGGTLSYESYGSDSMKYLDLTKKWVLSLIEQTNF